MDSSQQSRRLEDLLARATSGAPAACGRLLGLHWPKLIIGEGAVKMRHARALEAMPRELDPASEGAHP